MMKTTALRALCCWLLASVATSQEPAANEDWQKHVDRACTSPRYGVRLAASKKVAGGGDAAIPSVRAFAAKNGANALPVALVEAIAVDGADGPLVLDQLEAWAKNRDFYWRAQALRGLALRARKDDAARTRFMPLFDALHDDDAWLVRTFARYGASDPQRDIDVETAQSQRVQPTELDPRAATKRAALDGDARALFASLADERTFLGDPWGRRRSSEAIASLKALLSTDAGYRADATAKENEQALASLADAIAARDSGARPEVATQSDPALTFLGGVETLSCKNGDLFLRWTADGLVQGGASPDCPTSAQIAPARWAELLRTATPMQLPPQNGVVICDKMRIQIRPDLPQSAVAPESLPTPAAEWLKQLAAAIEESGQTPLADALRQRLGQFVSPASQAR
jgi:hypothetical protein